MNSDNEKDFRLLQLNFIGKILAGFTHEINNRMAIIRESAGLMDDMMRFGTKSGESQTAYTEIIRSIEEQLGKANSLTRFLNRFAHRMDMPVSETPPDEIIEELAALLERLARQKKIQIKTVFREKPPAIRTEASTLQFLVFAALEEKMTNLDENSLIVVTAEESGKDLVIAISAEGHEKSADNSHERMSAQLVTYAAKRVNANITRNDGEVRISLPIMS